MFHHRLTRLGAVTLGVALSVAGPAAPRAAAQPFLKGIDVSLYQKKIDWKKVKASGLTFALAKAGEGLTVIDPTFATNWAEMKKAGLVRGAYWYGHPNADPVKQAQRFVKTVKLEAGDLLLALDIETTDGKAAAEVVEWVRRFVEEVKKQTGRPPFLFTYPAFWKGLGSPRSTFGCPLWIAHYGVKTPSVPAAWPTWTCWQYSGKGRAAGITTPVDLDYFQGTLTELKPFTFASPPK